MTRLVGPRSEKDRLCEDPRSDVCRPAQGGHDEPLHPCLVLDEARRDYAWVYVDYDEGGHEIDEGASKEMIDKLNSSRIGALVWRKQEEKSLTLVKGYLEGLSHLALSFSPARGLSLSSF